METFTTAEPKLTRVAVVRILGVDPGTAVVGFGCLDLREGRPSRTSTRPLAQRVVNVVAGPCGGQKVEFIEAGVLRLGGRRVSIEHRLYALSRELGELLDRLAPQELALEEAFFGKSVQSALRIGEARGVVLAEASRRSVTVRQFAPARVKRCVTGNGAASKGAVARMAGQLLALESLPQPADATDALAVALCCVEERCQRL